MTELSFYVEWDEAPGVVDAELACTWGQLQIRIAGAPVTRFYNTRTQSVRSGTYGAMLPLARWLVERWWFLLNEATPSSQIFEGGRRALLESTDDELRQWLRRHNLLTAREGFALPDLSIFRDEAGIQLRWVPDPTEVRTPGRFLEDGGAVISERGFIAAVVDFVSSVADRLHDHDTGKRLSAALTELLLLTSEQASASQRGGLAALGLDPEADISDDDELRDALLVRLPALPDPLRRDVLEAAGEDLVRELSWVSELRERLRNIGAGNSGRFRAASLVEEHRVPHIAGYRRARAARKQMGLDASAPVLDLETSIARTFGPVREVEMDRRGTSTLVAFGADQSGLVVGAKSSIEPAKRFRLARALHHWMYAADVSQGRLLTRSHGWNQRASRAFAAEFLAPAEGIREQLAAADGDDLMLRAVAQRYRVSDQVLQLQIANHDI